MESVLFVLWCLKENQNGGQRDGKHKCNFITLIWQSAAIKMYTIGRWCIALELAGIQENMRTVFIISRADV